MEYIFGSVRRNGVLVENLKTVGDAHTDFNGYVSTRTELGDGTVVIDRCRVVEHYHAEEDAEGKCYDWYVIDNHYRYMDTAPAESKATKAVVGITAIEEALCEMDAASLEWTAAIEDALCELDSAE